MSIRLSKNEIEWIVSCIMGFDTRCKIFLYGSRTNPSAKGGDIDLLVESETLIFTDKIRILSELKSKLGERKIDLSILTPQALSENLFFQHVEKVLLSHGEQ